MHQLAIALKRKGYHITGSDDEVFQPSRTNLEKEGLLPAAMGWDAARVHSGLDAVILGMHAKADNPELQQATSLGLPVYSFPEYIYQESQDKQRVIVGGSHGKTTTTSMIMHVLRTAGKRFDYLVGARLDGFDQSVAITDAPVIVCEGDEYPASTLERRPKFHFLAPHIAVLTGIAWDHINVFPTFENYLEQFRIFLQKLEPGGMLIFNETDPELNALVAKNQRQDITYIPYAVPMHSISNGITTLEIEGQKAELKVFGNHNLLNAHAAWLVCRQLGVDAAGFVQAISQFTGAAKRLELLAQNDHIALYRDFAHAPSKVKATVDAARQQFPDRKIIALLELHTYSSLNEQFMQEYNGALNGADAAAVFFSKHALELKRMPPLPKAAVAVGFGKEGLEVLNTKAEIEAWLQGQQYDNSVVLFMSSGNYEGLDMSLMAQNITGEAG